MGLLSPLFQRTDQVSPLPVGAIVGTRWGPLAAQRRTCVGIDFGAGALKIVQLRWTRQGPRIENYAVIPTPPGLMEEGGISDPVSMGDLLRSGIAAMGLTQSVAGTCLGGPAIMMRYINLPRVPSEEMQSAMKFEAPQHLPVPEEHLIYDFTPVPEATGLPEHQMAVFLAGTQKKLVEGFLSTLGRAKLRPAAIELDCLATLRALQWTGAVAENSQLPFVILDFGEVGTRVSVIRYGVPMLSRTIPIGLHHIRIAVADSLQVPVAEAEMSLRLRGLQEDAEVASAMEPWVNSLLESIGRSVEFFLIQNRGAVLDRVLLTGGGATLPQLPETLAAYLKRILGTRSGGDELKVHPVGLAGLDVNPELLPGITQFGPLLMNALGSGLREGWPG